MGLEKLYLLFDRSFISPDPLECVPARGNFKDIELSAFLASTFAYGRAESIVKTVSYILDELGGHPYKVLESGDYKTRFKKFKYRFHKRADLIWLLGRLKNIYGEYGTLEKAFTAGSDSHKQRLIGFANLFRNSAKALLQQRAFLVPSPANGSACKRMNLFLRWMVRKDSVDIGLWKKVKTWELMIPLDVHVFRIASRIGLVEGKTANFKTAEELTKRLLELSAKDPIRYDFAICTLGKLGHCGKSIVKDKCLACILKNFCTAT